MCRGNGRIPNAFESHSFVLICMPVVIVLFLRRVYSVFVSCLLFLLVLFFALSVPFTLFHFVCVVFVCFFHHPFTHSA